MEDEIVKFLIRWFSVAGFIAVPYMYFKKIYKKDKVRLEELEKKLNSIQNSNTSVHDNDTKLSKIKELLNDEKLDETSKKTLVSAISELKDIIKSDSRKLPKS
ncbi:MAG: hypothetical protein AAF518_14885 [Spirochaetota bacterium]